MYKTKVRFSALMTLTHQESRFRFQNNHPLFEMMLRHNPRKRCLRSNICTKKLFILYCQGFRVKIFSLFSPILELCLGVTMYRNCCVNKALVGTFWSHFSTDLQLRAKTVETKLELILQKNLDQDQKGPFRSVQNSIDWWD